MENLNRPKIRNNCNLTKKLSWFEVWMWWHLEFKKMIIYHLLNSINQFWSISWTILLFDYRSNISKVHNRVFHDKEINHISVRLSNRSKVAQNKINFIKNCPHWGLNPQPLDHQSNALPIEPRRNLLRKRLLKWSLFVSYTTSHVGHF